jgi:KEOPS complex subunit Pcc1
MKYENEAELRIESDHAEIICRAIGVEGKRSIPRTEVMVECNGNLMILKIMASDINALRAAINSYMRWINLAIDIMEMV